MYEDLKGKVVLITGASRGIGRSIALEFSKYGTLVVINYKNNKEGAEETLKLVKESGGNGIIYKCDVSSNLEVKAMFEFVISKFGRIDVLVNNSGIAKIGLFIDVTEKDFDEMMNVNFKGVYNCSSYALKYMVERRAGAIINVSSIWGNVGASCEVLYSASKGAVNAFTKALGKEMASSGIRINAISPGVIDTDMNKKLSSDDKKALEEEIPMMRFGRGEEVAKAAVFLSSGEASYITAQVITIDGGFL